MGLCCFSVVVPHDFLVQVSLGSFSFTVLFGFVDGVLPVVNHKHAAKLQPVELLARSTYCPPAVCKALGLSS